MTMCQECGKDGVVYIDENNHFLCSDCFSTDATSNQTTQDSWLSGKQIINSITEYGFVTTFLVGLLIGGLISDITLITIAILFTIIFIAYIQGVDKK